MVPAIPGQNVSNFFILRDGKVIQVNPKILLIPEFYRIWERDKSKNKQKALKEFAFIYFMADYESEYNAYGLDKEVQIAEDVMEDKSYKADEMILEAMAKYETFQETHSMRYLKATRRLVDRLIKYYEDISNKTDEEYNPKFAADSMKSIEEIMEKIEKWERKVYGESEEMTIRGGGKVGLFEDKENATYLETHNERTN